MSNKRTQRIHEMQRRLFGERYVGATISKVRFPDGYDSKTLSWLEAGNAFLVVVGPPGTGKTYLCAALLEHLPMGCVYCRAYNERNLFQRLRDGMKECATGDYLRHLHDLIDDDLVIIDDIGSSGHTDWREEVLMEAVDYRYSIQKPTVFSSNLYRENFVREYSPRIASRLFAKENLIINMDGMTDYREVGK